MIFLFFCAQCPNQSVMPQKSLDFPAFTQNFFSIRYLINKSVKKYTIYFHAVLNCIFITFLSVVKVLSYSGSIFLKLQQPLVFMYYVYTKTGKTLMHLLHFYSSTILLFFLFYADFKILLFCTTKKLCLYKKHSFFSIYSIHSNLRIYIP